MLFVVQTTRRRFNIFNKTEVVCLLVYTIFIETAKANNLNVYTYLEYLFLYMPDTDWRNHLEELDMFLPWSETVQAECKN